MTVCRWGLVTATALVVALSGCAGLETSAQSDEGFAFETLRDYAWRAAEDQESGLDDFSREKVVEAVDRELAALGYRQTTESPDFVVIAFATGANRVESYDIPNYGYGYEAGRGYRFNYRIGTLIIDMIDVSTDATIWRGTAAGMVNDPERSAARERVIDRAVARLLASFPPRR